MKFGKYFTFTGVSGCGKGTQIDILKNHLPLELDEHFKDVVFTREPGGTLYAEDIRKQVKNKTLSPERELEYYGMARGNSLANVVYPALSEGKLVISDRNVFCSMAYQGGGRELGIEKVWNENKRWVRWTLPDVVVYFDIDLETAIKRSLGDNPDKFDKEDVLFWIRVEQGYRDTLDWIRENCPYTKIITVEDRKGIYSKEETFGKIMQELSPEIHKWVVNKEGAMSLERER